jgi:putative oxidoreductase
MSSLSHIDTLDSASGNASCSQPAPALRAFAELAGRFLLISLFLISGLGKITAYSATAGYMASAHVPGALLPLVIATEVGGSLALLLGWHTRAVSLLLAGFTFATAVLFHTNFGDQVQMIMFLKNISIVGAFLMLAANGAGPISLDARNTK